MPKFALAGSIESGGCPSSQKLSLDCILVDNRPNRRDLGTLELVEDVLRKRDLSPVDAQAEELALRGALESEAGCNTRRLADQHLDVESKIRDISGILHQHVTVAGQLEWSVVVLNLVINVVSELVPIPTVQTIDVGTVKVGKGRSEQNRTPLGSMSAS